MTAEAQASAAQRCVECGRQQPAGERGWRALLTVDNEVAVYCPECSEREFGPSARIEPDLT